MFSYMIHMVSPDVSLDFKVVYSPFVPSGSGLDEPLSSGVDPRSQQSEKLQTIVCVEKSCGTPRCVPPASETNTRTTLSRLNHLQPCLKK